MQQCLVDSQADEYQAHCRCEPDRAPLNVALLLSGGVDSSVALRLAKRAGHRVTAYYLQIWFEEDFRNYWNSCPWEDDLQFCQQVLSHLNHQAVSWKDALIHL